VKRKTGFCIHPDVGSAYAGIVPMSERLQISDLKRRKSTLHLITSLIKESFGRNKFSERGAVRFHKQIKSPRYLGRLFSYVLAFRKRGEGGEFQRNLITPLFREIIFGSTIISEERERGRVLNPSHTDTKTQYPLYS